MCLNLPKYSEFYDERDRTRSLVTFNAVIFEREIWTESQKYLGGLELTVTGL